ncbi:MAG: hypothetical protein UU08_C0002G0038 [Candidatus Uhrbacteria bacterium GW2011_GWE2_40_58]|nr:MAG: hypothetical protein UT94_C0003G0022 [Candidatus Uhrbacteria bacterium GW2011_GWF2_40_263]KKR68187.1 MAG: hypothetical protein UU08_C0002G0038 [Candidatus Uhrbacteria bacterium GW2011_GWE2_40_58]OGL91908.1 MAG: RIP metalloprotease RseP [Candidatus Uhrbacteria bacterium RIFOXYA2_FULL_40_9]OGL97659.1 MAG: RIP metalloprotease RseP [Candidatus Uhrbacteria bacterium RIFOXYB2_FULL_41_18]HBK34649.1 RIP metalloprotease RseP [Candidatus Uhrbacteria bacterium]
MLWTILIFIFILSLLVFVHEFGHFFIAKKSGMKVEEFGFGFPPRLFGIRKGETIYSVNWIPLGGFVRIKGESGDFKDEEDSFSAKPALNRFAVLVAGVAMNFILAGILFSLGFLIGMPSLITEEMPYGANVESQEIRILSVVEESPAQLAGIESGDIFISANSRFFEQSKELQEYLGQAGKEGVEIVVKHSDETYQTVTLVSEILPEIGISGLGLGLVQTGVVSYPIHLAIFHGTEATIVMTGEVFSAFAQIIRNLLVHQEVGLDISGPVGIAVMTGEVVSLGLVYLIHFAALLSINLGVINLLPFPALDGGRIVFLIIEKIRRKAVSQKIEALVHNLGFLFLMLLIILVTYRDVISLSH